MKLHLDSEEDAEYIVGKAVRDGVIEGRIVHEKGWMECGGQKSRYGPEVSDVFSRRVAYCLELHNQSVKVCCWLMFLLLALVSCTRGRRQTPDTPFGLVYGRGCSPWACCMTVRLLVCPSASAKWTESIYLFLRFPHAF